ncbi:MAG: hypothetical protein EXR81_02990 [Gammaproteobacteria bacterium]|nr:hypothetical protein [Gammaproteobacteria bacterium]
MAHDGNNSLTEPLLGQEEASFDAPTATIIAIPLLTPSELTEEPGCLAQAAAYFREGWQTAKDYAQAMYCGARYLATSPELRQGAAAELNLGLSVAIAWTLFAEAKFKIKEEADNGGNLFKILGFFIALLITLVMQSAIPRIARAIAGANEQAIPHLFTPLGWHSNLANLLKALEHVVFINTVNNDFEGEMPQAVFIILELCVVFPALVQIFRDLTPLSDKLLCKCVQAHKTKTERTFWRAKVSAMMAIASPPIVKGGTALGYGIAFGAHMEVVAAAFMNYFINAYRTQNIEDNTNHIVLATVMGFFSVAGAIYALKNDEHQRSITQGMQVISNILGPALIGMDIAIYQHPSRYQNSAAYPGAVAGDEVASLLSAIAFAIAIRLATPYPPSEIERMEDKLGDDLARHWGVSLHAPKNHKWVKWFLTTILAPFNPKYKELAPAPASASPSVTSV